MNVTASAVGTSRHATGPREPLKRRHGGNRHRRGAAVDGASHRPRRSNQPRDARESATGNRPGDRFSVPTNSPLASRWEARCSCSRRRGSGDLGGERSPWKERASRCWQRHRIATDSSGEKSPETRALCGAASTSASGNGRRTRCHPLRSACATASTPGLPGADVSSARRFHRVTPVPPRRHGGAHRVKRTVLGRRRGTARTAPTSSLAGDVLGTQRTATSVAVGVQQVGGQRPQ